MTGVELIAQERQRQIEEEKYDIEGDKNFNPNEELARSAVCYALPNDNKIYDYYGKPILWPWHKRYYKPCPNDRIRELVKAGALIAAEIDRLQEIDGKEND